MDGKVKSLIESFSNQPVMVSLKTGEASENVNQDVVRYSGDTERTRKLHDILISEQVEKSIIFSETQRSVEKLTYAN